MQSRKRNGLCYNGAPSLITKSFVKHKWSSIIVNFFQLNYYLRNMYLDFSNKPIYLLKGITTVKKKKKKRYISSFFLNIRLFFLFWGGGAKLFLHVNISLRFLYFWNSKMQEMSMSNLIAPVVVSISLHGSKSKGHQIKFKMPKLCLYARLFKNWVWNHQFDVLLVHDYLCSCYLADLHSELSVETNKPSD